MKRRDAAVSPRKLIKAVSDGYWHAPAIERTSFGALTSFTTTIFAARAINNTRQGGQRSRRKARFTRRIPGRGDGSREVHHYLAGLAVALASSGLALLTRDDAVARRLSIPFGSGLALALDEPALLVRKRDRSYWATQQLALGEAIAGALGCAVVAIRFLRRGRAAPDGSPARSATSPRRA
ncbi:MAG: hypothetical protein M3P50_05915 [Actinomycetota bacterium]|nr:hypothetical protein [Actinomycetota bacterium]